MKNTFFLLSAASVMFALSSCGKSNLPTTYANLLIANGCVGATSTSLSANGTNIPSVSSLDYLSNFGYLNVPSGSVTFNETLNGVGSLGTITTTLSQDSSYSFFAGGTILADTLICIADHLAATNGSYANVRLVNMSSDTSATSITGAVGNTLVGSGIAYGGASGFTQITPGSYSITAFNVNEPANVATLIDVQLNGGRIYTLMYSGNATQTVGFKLTIINN